MTLKRSNLKEWAKQISSEWKHIPSFKGKHCERNLFILKSLIITESEGMSAWDLALQYMKETEPKFNLWSPDTVFHKRQSENSQMNRRLRFMKEKEYVRKSGSKYSISSKGFFLMFAIDPTIVNDITLSKWSMSWPEMSWENDTENFLMNIKSMTKTGGLDGVKQFFSDELTRKTTSFVIRNSLIAWKINVDEMAETEFLKAVINGLQQWAAKKGLRFQSKRHRR